MEGREAHFGTNKIFRQPPPIFWEFVKEGLSDKMIIVLICCSIFEILISMYYIFNEDEIESICLNIQVLYNTFLETKYKNIQEKFSDDKYNKVSIYTDI